MRFSIHVKVMFVLAVFLLMLSGSACAGTVERFSDVRWIGGQHLQFGNTLPEVTYRSEAISTFWFNDRVKFDGSETLAASILEAGKNPGLGVRSLHARGITGKDVRVAIIDMPNPRLHPEYRDKFEAYFVTKDFRPQDGDVSMNVYEMHGPAVVSLLVGKESGTAPGAKLYYAATPMWTYGILYLEQALRWIIEENNKLPAVDKIRVVSVSANPDHPLWAEAVAEAKVAGILVLDCRDNDETGIILNGYYDLDDPDDISRFTPGSPKDGMNEIGRNISGSKIFAPAARRSQAEEYDNTGGNRWQYTGDGGISWSIPYAAGILAMGWQVDPTLTNDEIITLLRDTAYLKDGYRIINPVKFIEAIENR